MQDDTVATAWLNNEDVRKAIHAEPVRYNFAHLVPTLNMMIYFYQLVIDLWFNLVVQQATVTGPWELCKHLNFTHDAGSMLPYHKNLTTRGYRALIYRFNIFLSLLTCILLFFCVTRDIIIM